MGTAICFFLLFVHITVDVQSVQAVEIHCNIVLLNVGHYKQWLMPYMLLINELIENKE